MTEKAMNNTFKKNKLMYPDVMVPRQVSSKGSF